MLRSIFCLLMALIVSCGPVCARDVYFDSENSNPLLHAQLKPYCIDARKQVEAVWDRVDPHNGQQVQIIFVLGPEGQLRNIFPRTLDDNPLIQRAVFSVTQCGSFRPLPSGQDSLVILATFNSKHPAFKPNYELIADTAIAAALLGLTGLAIYGLLRLERNGGGYVNPNYHWVNPYYTAAGTYVPGHYQTNPNGTMLDNYSTQGNINPWTGQPGWVVPVR